ncbi:MAG: hypothetical protein INR66_04305 [Gordonia polyisoprenivorans]|nr:hypothetical protein [Gordonia polyisoprenivorans]
MVDWSALGDRLAREIVDAVAHARSVAPRDTVARVEVVDVHTRDLLVLWPTFLVHMTDRVSSPVVVEGSRHGDLCAAEVTSLGGPGGTRWDAVFARFQGVLATGCAAASRAAGVPVSVARDAAGGDAEPADIDEHVAVDGPLDYGPLTDTLVRSPTLDGALAAGLSAETVRAIDADDVATAIAALESPWESVRRHAAIILLSAHL